MKGLLASSLLLTGWLVSGTPCVDAAVVLPMSAVPAESAAEPGAGTTPETPDLRYAPLRAEAVSAQVLERIAAHLGVVERVNVPLTVDQPAAPGAPDLFDARVTVPADLTAETAAPEDAASAKLGIDPIPEVATGILGLAGVALAALVPVAVLLFTQGSSNRQAGSPARGGR